MGFFLQLLQLIQTICFETQALFPQRKKIAYVYFVPQFFIINNISKLYLNESYYFSNHNLRYQIKYILNELNNIKL